MTELSSASSKSITINHVTYALYLFGLFTSGGLLWLVPIIMNYFFCGDAKGTWVESHHCWQIRSFWESIFLIIIGYGLFIFGGGAAIIGIAKEDYGVAIGGSLLFVILGVLVLFIGYIWNIYRIVRGWIALADKRAI